MISAEKIAQTLSDIQKRIPKILLERSISEKKSTPTLEKMVDLALNDPNFPEEKKRGLQILKDSGDISRVIIVENKKYTKMIDNFVEREIKKEIRKGNLPPRSKIKNLPHIKEIMERVQANQKQNDK